MLDFLSQEIRSRSTSMREGEETKYVMLWTESLATTSNPAIPPRWPTDRSEDLIESFHQLDLIVSI